MEMLALALMAVLLPWLTALLLLSQLLLCTLLLWKVPLLLQLLREGGMWLAGSACTACHSCSCCSKPCTCIQGAGIEGEHVSAGMSHA
jgi:hypothetical protein